MVQLKVYAVLILFWSQSTRSAKEGKKPFECDLVLQAQQEAMMYPSENSPKVYVALDSYTWPKTIEGHVIVPYYIARGSRYSSEELSLIRYSMDAIESETCIRFRPRKKEYDYINIFSGKYCKSNLGRTGGGQEMSLNKKKCMEKGIIMHELLHALGYIHMHNRPDRDKYVNILWKNIDPRFFKEFSRVNPSIFTTLGTPYDYRSIMHYGHSGFSKNGGYTIVPKNDAYLHVIGQRTGLSEGDIRRINSKYNCKVEKSYSHSFNNYDKYTASPYKESANPKFEHKSRPELKINDHSITPYFKHKSKLEHKSRPDLEFKSKVKFDDDDIDNLFNL